MTRKECLDAAAGCVLKDRQNEYGGPENNFERIAQMWNGYLGTNSIKPWDVAAMMILLKMARARFNPKREDDWIDAAGYASCGIECATAQEEFDKALDEFQKKSMERMFKRDEGGKPEFNPGDRVQFRDEIPSTSEPHWFDGTYVERLPDGGHAVSFGPNGHVIHCSDKEIRPAPKEAEGCEELVQEDGEYRKGDLVEIYCYNPNGNEWQPAVYECIYGDNDDEPENLHVVRLPDGKLCHVASGHLRRAGELHEDCEGCLYKTYADSHTEEHDAPQTKEELIERIKSANPAIYGAHIE